MTSVANSTGITNPKTTPPKMYSKPLPPNLGTKEYLKECTNGQQYKEIPNRSPSKKSGKFVSKINSNPLFLPRKRETPTCYIRRKGSKGKKREKGSKGKKGETGARITYKQSKNIGYGRGTSGSLTLISPKSESVIPSKSKTPEVDKSVNEIKIKKQITEIKKGLRKLFTDF